MKTEKSALACNLPNITQAHTINHRSKPFREVSLPTNKAKISNPWLLFWEYQRVPREPLSSQGNWTLFPRSQLCRPQLLNSILYPQRVQRKKNKKKIQVPCSLCLSLVILLFGLCILKEFSLGVGWFLLGFCFLMGLVFWVLSGSDSDCRVWRCLWISIALLFSCVVAWFQLIFSGSQPGFLKLESCCRNLRLFLNFLCLLECSCNGQMVLLCDC